MHRDDYRATLILMLGLGAATLTGFMREAALAHQLGAGRITDTYLIAFSIPEFFFVALPIVLVPALIPLLADIKLRAGEPAAWRFVGRVAPWLAGFFLAVAALLALAAPLYLRWLGAGLAPPDRAEALRAEYVMLPALVLMAGATLAGAILQVYRRFARPAMATAVYNLAFAAALFAWPSGWLLGRAAWGVTLGAAAALLLQGTLVARSWRSARLAAAAPDCPDPPAGIRDVARVAGPLALAYAVHHAIYFVDRAMASTLAAGSVATLNYGYRVALVAGQLSGLAVSTAILPRMAEQVSGGDLAGLRRSLAAALRFVWLVGLPAGCALVVLRRPLVQVLFERGAFGPAATAAVSQVLAWYALAVLADALCQPFWRVLYARRNTGRVLAVNAVQTAVRIACNLVLIGSLGYNGLALSAAIGLAIQVLVLAVLTRRQIGPFATREWWLSAARIALAAAGAAAVGGLVGGLLRAGPGLLIVAAGGLSGGAAYLLGLRLVKEGMQ